MATRAPLRDTRHSHVEPTQGLLEKAEEWAEATGLAPEGEPEEGVPWHAVLLIVAALALLIIVEITIVLGIARLVTGHAY